ncbi:hypothetical protein GCM10010302_25280 [Streptomyces polychromogenes]|uniref:Uncharacterized protein n=1 Tax=Streptomyces polychromogenes TaxID=67342 RepID=A0ABN0VCP9_9ACTN
MGLRDEHPGSPDFRLTGFAPANALVEDNFELVTTATDELSVVAQHHSADGRNTYLIFYDTTAVYGHPGAPAYIAAHATRDRRRRVFDFEHASHPLVPLAQSWLTERGFPTDALVSLPAHGPRPADDTTSRLEGLLRANPGNGYQVLDHYTEHESRLGYGTRTTALVHDAHPRSAANPFRVFLEEVDPDFETYTIREGAFSSIEAADIWIAAGNLPLPQTATPSVGRRAGAARAKTACPGPSSSPSQNANALVRRTSTQSPAARRGGR